MADPSFKLNALPKGSLILVTGGNGFIASHIIDLLLQLGFRVRGTIRAKKPWLDDLFQQKYGPSSFESVVIPSLEEEGPIDAAMQGVSGVVHVASDVSFELDPAAVIGRAVKFIETILAVVKRHDSVKRFVLTSSSSAVIIPKSNQVGVRVDEKTWNDEAVKAAWDPQTPEEGKGYAIYAASKTESERAAWKWVERNNPGFIFNTVLPNYTIGENLSPEIPGSTSGWARKLLDGHRDIFSIFIPQYYVNVTDVARLHVIALLAPDVEKQRIFAFAAAFNLTEIIDRLRVLDPENKKIPDPPQNEGHDLTEVVPAPRAESLLKEYFGASGWISLQDSLESCVRGH
ncbi:unnamed protein product [Clonostachys solani]|uniref:NAD-dependent epimerase/dehydratase domain-containing protein n=1 Tax=Clonostachys solani TaxID=160281 RepID=A0A9N9YTN1_9HYPO|nr:unnamed protein product [Clonostachys solani]